MEGNREHKNSMFATLFSDPEKLYKLYNAIADTDYGADTPFEVNTETKKESRKVSERLKEFDEIMNAIEAASDEEMPPIVPIRLREVQI